MAYIHLTVGLVLFVVFAITGRYMRADFPDKEEMDQTLRVLMRSRHIYILFSALLHLSLGVYLRPRSYASAKVMQIAGSVFLILSSVLLVWAFVFETYELHGFSSYSRNGIYSALAGVGLHVIALAGARRDRPDA
jgi:hypothetical protein